MWRPTTEPNAENDCCEINPNTTLISPLPQVTEDAGEEGQRERELESWRMAGELWRAVLWTLMAGELRRAVLWTLTSTSSPKL